VKRKTVKLIKNVNLLPEKNAWHKRRHRKTY